MSSRSLICLILFIGLAHMVPVNAEIIVLPNGQVQALKLKQQPTRGSAMQQVRAQFGEPLKILPPVKTAHGYPTITRWIYPNYTVYFSNRHVIHTVVSSTHPNNRLGK